MNTSADKSLSRSANLSALRISGIYLLVAVIWVYASDRVLLGVAEDLADVTWFQTVKGIFFVTSTAALLFWLYRRKFVELLHAQQHLRESRRQFLTLLGNLQGMAYRCKMDEHWTMLFVSSGCMDLTGYHHDDLVNNRVTYERIIHPDDRQRVRQVVEYAVQHNKRFQIEYRIIDALGRQRWVWEQGIAIMGPDGSVEALEGFITDFTDRKRAEHLERERSRFNETRRAMAQSLSVAAHELRTPLTSVRAMAEYLLTDGREDLETQTQFLKQINAEAVRLADMVQDMLEAARLEAGAAAWRWGQVYMERMIHEAAEVIRPLVDTARVKLLWRVEPTARTMLGDSDAIRRLVLNLVANAARHTTEGHIQITADAYVENDRLWLRLIVEDTGEGMDPGIIQKLGVAFALHAGDKPSHVKGGSGLGLAICRQIVAAHAGRITVSSRPGEGATFTVRMRADLKQPAADEAPPIQAESSDEPAFAASR